MAREFSMENLADELEALLSGRGRRGRDASMPADAVPVEDAEDQTGCDLHSGDVALFAIGGQTAPVLVGKLAKVTVKNAPLVMDTPFGPMEAGRQDADVIVASIHHPTCRNPQCPGALVPAVSIVCQRKGNKTSRWTHDVDGSPLT